MDKERVEQILKNSKLFDLKRTHGWKDAVECFENTEDGGFSLNYVKKNYSLEQQHFQTEEEFLRILYTIETRILKVHEKIYRELKPLTDKYPEYIKKVNDTTYAIGQREFSFEISNISPNAGEFSNVISFHELENNSPHNHIGLVSNSEKFPSWLRRYMICFLCKNEFEKHYDSENNPWIRGFDHSLIDFYLDTYRVSMNVEEKGCNWLLTFTAKIRNSEQVITKKSAEGSLEEVLTFAASYAKRKRKEDRLNTILN